MRRDSNSGIEDLLPAKKSTKASRGGVPVEMTEALAQFDAAKLAREAFRQKHAKTMEAWEQLNRKVDEAYETAKSTYLLHRDVLGKSFGGFAIQDVRGVNTALLLELMPDAIALVEYKLNVKEFEKLVRDGTIPEDIAEQVVCTASEKVTGPER